MSILFAKNSVLQKERDDLLRHVIQTRSSEDRKSLNVEQTHERTGRPVVLLIWLMGKTAHEYVLLMKAIRSTLKKKYFVKERKNPLLIMTRVMNQ